MRSAVPDRPVRAALFGSVKDVAHAVRGLLKAGFRQDRISVVCSDRTKEALFAAYEHEHPAGDTTPTAAGVGALIGGIAAGAAGLVAVSGLVTTSGVGLVVVGPLLAGTGAAFGTFVGAMMSRGVEDEVANYYDQALPRGMILVAAEIDARDDAALLERAERVFEESGAHPVALPHG
jgi:hypothetical protein